jgi:hypothetical protein
METHFGDDAFFLREPIIDRSGFAARTSIAIRNFGSPEKAISISRAKHLCW